MPLTIQGHPVDDPPLALGPALGLEPLVNAELERGDRRLDIRRAGDRREGAAEDQEPGIVGRGQDASGPARHREVAADELVGVVVEVVLDGDRVELLVRVGRAEVGEEADLVVQAVDVEDLVLDVGIDLPRRHLGVHARRAPEPAHARRCSAG